MIIVETEKYRDENQTHPKSHHPEISTDNILTYMVLCFAYSGILILLIKRS